MPKPLLHRRDTPLDGSAPRLQTGDCACGMIREPVCFSARLRLRERGSVDPIAHVPFVDVLGTMLDVSLPLTAAEFDQWGDPNQAPFCAAIRACPPDQDVRVQDGPPMRVTTGLSAAQMQYREPVE